MIDRLLYRISAHLPCRFIDGDQGEPYLERYYLFGAFGWHAYLHHFVDSDPDRGLHDHPWSRAVSLVLYGGYHEQRPTDGDFERVSVRKVRPFRLNYLLGKDFHRVVLQKSQRAWTAFFHGPRVKGWGFMQDGEVRSMANDASEFRHRDWWRTAPKGSVMRERRGEALRHL